LARTRALLDLDALADSCASAGFGTVMVSTPLPNDAWTLFGSAVKGI
jgi:hypothetical protein